MCITTRYIEQDIVIVFTMALNVYWSLSEHMSILHGYKKRSILL